MAKQMDYVAIALILYHIFSMISHSSHLDEFIAYATNSNSNTGPAIYHAKENDGLLEADRDSLEVTKEATASASEKENSSDLKKCGNADTDKSSLEQFKKFLKYYMHEPRAADEASTSAGKKIYIDKASLELFDKLMKSLRHAPGAMDEGSTSAGEKENSSDLKECGNVNTDKSSLEQFKKFLKYYTSEPGAMDEASTSAGKKIYIDKASLELFDKLMKSLRHAPGAMDEGSTSTGKKENSSNLNNVDKAPLERFPSLLESYTGAADEGSTSTSKKEKSSYMKECVDKASMDLFDKFVKSCRNLLINKSPAVEEAPTPLCEKESDSGTSIGLSTDAIEDLPSSSSEAVEDSTSTSPSIEAVESLIPPTDCTSLTIGDYLRHAWLSYNGEESTPPNFDDM